MLLIGCQKITHNYKILLGKGKIMKLGITKEGYAEYVWTTPDRYEVTTSQVEDIRDIVKDATGKIMSFEDILRMVDIFKSFESDYK